MIKTDVLIIGGGLAGLSAAVTLCAESNLQVMLVESRRIGANAGIRAVFLDAVSEFGLEASVLQRYAGFIFASPSGACARFDYGRPQLGAVDYQHACAILAERAVRHGLNLRIARADHWSPATPDAAQPVTIYLTDGECIETQVVIDASGAVQWAARQLRFAQSRHLSVCYGEQLTGVTFEDPTYVRLLAPNSRYGNGGGWFYPTAQNAVSLGYAILIPRSQKNRTNLVVGYWDAKRTFQPYADWVGAGMRQRIEGGMIPVGRVERFCADRILIVGDAAGQANPWWVEGCRPALCNGRLCAQVLLDAFNRCRFGRTALARYERHWSKVNGEKFWREASLVDLKWMRTDEEWETYISAYRRLSPQEQFESLRDDSASLFHQVYAIAGYWRRQLVKRIQEVRAK
jgi:digeranylgeranylglycerophospholipid reductase